MNTTTNYRSIFLDQFNTLKTHPAFKRMKYTVESSPWHHEDNVLVHTEMVVDQYVENSPVVWSLDDYLGGMCCSFHDTGKPDARTEKFNEARGTYYSYPGHELISSRTFEDYAASHYPMFSAEDIYKVCWMIEYHMPWEITNTTKREHMALTANAVGIDVFTRALMADTVGRISDDAAGKRAKSIAWVEEFKQLASTVESSLVPTAPVLYLPIGPSGCGKSTLLKTLREQDPSIDVFSLDLLRHEFYDMNDYAVAFQKSIDDKQFQSRADVRFRSIIKQRNTLFVDNTNLSAKRRRKYLDAAGNAGYRLVALLMPTPIYTVLCRQQIRGDKVVPESAVRKQYFSLQLPMFGEFDEIVSLNNNLIK